MTRLETPARAKHVQLISGRERGLQSSDIITLSQTVTGFTPVSIPVKQTYFQQAARILKMDISGDGIRKRPLIVMKSRNDRELLKRFGKKSYLLMEYVVSVDSFFLESLELLEQRNHVTLSDIQLEYRRHISGHPLQNEHCKPLREPTSYAG